MLRDGIRKSFGNSVSLTRYCRKVAVAIVAKCIYIVLKCLNTTWRTEVVGQYHLETAVQKAKSGRQFLAAIFWHGDYLTLFSILQGIPVCVFVSKSFRGEVIRNICHYFKYSCEIVSRQQPSPLKIMQNALFRYNIVALAADGPLGPFHRIKLNILRLAATQNVCLLPIAVASSRGYQFQSRWDKFKLPYPFSHIVIIIGPPIRLASRLGEESIDKKQLEKFANIVRQSMEHNDALARQSLKS